MLHRGDDITPINEFLHHVIIQLGARITGSFPVCSPHGEDDRTMAEGRVKANGGGRKSVRQQFQIERERRRVGGRLPVCHGSEGAPRPTRRFRNTPTTRHRLTDMWNGTTCQRNMVCNFSCNMRSGRVGPRCRISY